MICQLKTRTRTFIIPTYVPIFALPFGTSINLFGNSLRAVKIPWFQEDSLKDEYDMDFPIFALPFGTYLFGNFPRDVEIPWFQEYSVKDEDDMDDGNVSNDSHCSILFTTVSPRKHLVLQSNMEDFPYFTHRGYLPNPTQKIPNTTRRK